MAARAALLFQLLHCAAGLRALDGAKDLLWLPLGDSITWGCGTDAAPRGGPACAADAGGYRVPLSWALSQEGFNVSTMGTLFTGPGYVPAQWLRHEGHPGWRYDQIDAILDTSLKTSPRPPDLITVHLGTNDCDYGASTAVLNARLQSLLNHTLERMPSAHVFLASMISLPRKPACADEFNKGLPAQLATFAARGMKVVYTPMQEWSGVCTATGADDPLSGLCCGGKIHPTAAGYLRMASAFALSISESGAFARAGATRRE